MMRLISILAVACLACNDSKEMCAPSQYMCPDNTCVDPGHCCFDERMCGESCIGSNAVCCFTHLECPPGASCVTTDAGVQACGR